MKPYISVVIPVHNEERRLSNCLELVIPFLSTNYPSIHEIIIVDNGSTDDTFKIARAYSSYTYAGISAISIPLRGKGLAVKRGMLFAEGRYRLMCDVDLSTPIECLLEFMALRKKYDVIIGSREVTPSLVKTPLKRRVIGRAFHALVNGLVPGVLDTQCGFKLFSDVAARAIFGSLQLPGMAFDVEALYLAKLMGFRVAEHAVPWEHNPDSRVRLLWDSLDMAKDVISIPWLHMTKQIPA